LPLSTVLSEFQPNGQMASTAARLVGVLKTKSGFYPGTVLVPNT
jgi:hypothetical protein